MNVYEQLITNGYYVGKSTEILSPVELFSEFFLFFFEPKFSPAKAKVETLPELEPSCPIDNF